MLSSCSLRNVLKLISGGCVAPSGPSLQGNQIHRLVDRLALLSELLAAGRVNVRLKIRMETTATTAVEVALIRRWIEVPWRLIGTVPKRTLVTRTEGNRIFTNRDEVVCCSVDSCRIGLDFGCNVEESLGSSDRHCPDIVGGTDAADLCKETFRRNRTNRKGRKITGAKLQPAPTPDRNRLEFD